MNAWAHWSPVGWFASFVLRWVEVQPVTQCTRARDMYTASTLILIHNGSIVLVNARVLQHGLWSVYKWDPAYLTLGIRMASAAPLLAYSIRAPTDAVGTRQRFEPHPTLSAFPTSFFFFFAGSVECALIRDYCICNCVYTSFLFPKAHLYCYGCTL